MPLTDRIDVDVSTGLGRDLIAKMRRMILSGAYPPGSRLMPSALQEQFDVSVIPVREALRTLEAEGLVESRPRRGTRVSSLRLVELTDVYALRTLIEPDLARRAAFARNETHVARARHAYEAMDEAADGNPEGWVTAHREFHWSLLDVELGPVSVRILRELWGVSDRYVFLAASAFRTDKPARDHHRLMEAFVAKDGEAIAAEWTDHLRLVEQDIRRDFGDAFDMDVSTN